MQTAALFNARDWDGVRELLSEDARLDLLTRSQRTGRRAVGGYLTEVVDGLVASIRDFRYVSYIADEAEIRFTGKTGSVFLSLPQAFSGMRRRRRVKSE